jgi:hypothetical protein
VRDLEKLIEETKIHARALAVELVGDFPYTDEFLRHQNLREGDPLQAIDEGKASGLTQDIKEGLRKKFIAAQEALRALVGVVRPLDPKYVEADNKLNNTRADFENAELRRADLLAQIRRAFVTIQALEEGIKKTQAVVGKLETEQEALRDGNIRTGGEAYDAARGEEERTKRTLAEHRARLAGLEQVLAALEKSIEQLTGDTAKMADALQIYATASERLAQVKILEQHLERTTADFPRRRDEVTKNINPALVTAGSGVNDTVSEIIGYTGGIQDTVSKELLDRADELSKMLREFANTVEEADRTTPQPQDLQWDAYRRVLELAERLNRFTHEDWERLRGGSLGKIAAISDEFRELFERALAPFDVLSRASGEIAVIRTQRQPPAAVAPASGPGHATTQQLPGARASTPPAPAATSTSGTGTPAGAAGDESAPPPAQPEAEPAPTGDAPDTE